MDITDFLDADASAGVTQNTLRVAVMPANQTNGTGRATRLLGGGAAGENGSVARTKVVG